MRWSNQPVRKPARHVADPPEPLAGGPHGRRWVAILGALLLAVSTVAGVAGTSKAAGPTIVSLTFDDGLGSQLAAAQELKAHGLVGTFFITTSFVGQSGFLTQANLNTLVADGNEIGGHSVTHPDMTTLSAAAASAEACNSKSTLEGWGFTVRNFAYPFAAENATAQSAVRGCGYASSRGLGDIRSPASCAGCPVAETLPPANPMVTQAPDQVDSTWTMATLQAAVTNAESTGGWLQLTFHEIATGTDPTLSISPALFKEFVTWLAARTANGTTSVRTVAQALGQSPVASPPPSPSPSPSPSPTPTPSAGPAVRGAIGALWVAQGAGNGPLGSPVTNEVSGLRNGGVYQSFQGGQVHWSPTTGAHSTRGGIGTVWAGQGWENGKLGYPLSSEIPGLKGGGVYQVFQGGQIHWSPASGGHATLGAIGAAWSAQGWENGGLGYPVSREVTGLRNGGAYQVFQGGQIHWSAATGAHGTKGAIGAAWAAQGWENGLLGYPTSDEYIASGGVAAQNYQGGQVTWSPARGISITY
ncbi:peptidoglycan/xylan/chitin deacetylase (PgdA/CDA1 family) [Arthrobacter sp. PvP023]|uniref:polysaccharide deacetylase family protein n=1 Tax=Micrococcaceae TaxID=1268 RepID=UPI001AE36F10|nr:polysaccharide deacetylase family protein [Arthrobacter sp. PvP023]MBP1135999.1 peptidoglycan/xylan/chitin deacetylase (PgdA/CDA1 family) [Arthrobacter sp. PvP023]